MRPFEPAITLIVEEPTRALVDTPLGTMAFDALAGGQPFLTKETLVGDAGLQLRRCSHPDAEVELLLLPFPPRLPEGKRVDGCVAAVWRARAKEDGTELAFRAVWEPGARNEDGGGDTGEHLTALTWDAPGEQVSLGTSDEERLSYAAEDGFLPARLAPLFRGEDAIFTPFVGERDGLKIVMPPLLAGETAQVHMVLVWVEGNLANDECAPWFAVDVTPKEIAKMAYEALGASQGTARSSL